MTSSLQAPSALKAGFSNMSYQADEHVAVSKVVVYAYLYPLNPRWLYCDRVTIIIYQGYNAVVLSKLDLELPVSISLIQARTFGYDGLDFGLTLFLCLLIRGGRAFLSVQTIRLVTSILESLFKTTTDGRCFQVTVWRGCQKAVPETVEVIVLGLAGNG
jgi:hypothetical protein